VFQLELKQLGTELAVVIVLISTLQDSSVKVGRAHSDPVLLSLRQHLPNPLDKLRIDMEEICVAEVKHCSFDQRVPNHRFDMAD